MIELIFVIVILGILAAVAIPKLAATRSDAEAAKIASDLATCVGDAGGAYLKDGNFSSITTAADNTNWTAATSSSTACDSAVECFNIQKVDSNGTLTITDTGNSNKCTEAHNLAHKNNMSSAAGVTHQF